MVVSIALQADIGWYDSLVAYLGSIDPVLAAFYATSFTWL
jgi:hypothetical protein